MSRTLEKIKYVNDRHTEKRTVGPGSVISGILVCLLEDKAMATEKAKELQSIGFPADYLPYFTGSHVFNLDGSIEPKKFITFVRAHVLQELNPNTINRTRQKVLQRRKKLTG